MHSKPSNEEIINTLYSEIPEFKKYAIEYIDEEFLSNVFLIMGPFGGILSDWIIKQASPALIDRCYSFINHLCENSDKEIEQMLKATFFEHLMDFKKTIEMSKLKLNGKALIFFEDVLNGPIFDQGRYAT